MTDNKILEVNDLTISFKTDNGLVRAVRGVSFDLSEGETLCIVGESGSGKSVTSKAIMGILSSNAVVEGGQIMYQGENLLEVSEEEFHKIRGHKIGMIFQDPLSSLNPIVRIGKQITEATLINSNKVKILYNNLISKELTQYKNKIAKMKININRAKEVYLAKEKAVKEALKNKELPLTDKLNLKEELKAAKANLKEQIVNYKADCKKDLPTLKAALVNKKAEAKQEIAKYKSDAKNDYNEKVNAILAKYTKGEDDDKIKAELKKEYEQKSEIWGKLRDKAIKKGAPHFYIGRIPYEQLPERLAKEIEPIDKECSRLNSALRPYDELYFNSTGYVWIYYGL